ncbi:uncharacterized protein TNCV_5076751 [Trichonephila clavipes]|uniref:Uncharacterized protein n=1 Tax=Trichonephila clavipes TaxID=2585209 RepID=A0A8X6VAV4_TRICX|nr:uncharacterized protein TNCV_5076751 [Trichonephila clavipes]
MPYPEFESRPYGTAISVTNHYTGWASARVFTSHCSATQGLLATDLVILNHGQMTTMTLELVPSLLTTTLQQWEDVQALDRFNVHRSPTRRVFSEIRLELMTRRPRVHYLDHQATTVTYRMGDSEGCLTLLQ